MMESYIILTEGDLMMLIVSLMNAESSIKAETGMELQRNTVFPAQMNLMSREL